MMNNLKAILRFPLFLVLLVISCMCLGVNAQDPIADEETFEQRYSRNIKKSRINGVYIPKDLDEAMDEIEALSSEEAIAKFKSGEESLVSRRLHFGLGRWMIYNWNFYEGSRFSHYCKELGIAHPDDMARFVIVSLHRELNGKDLNIDGQVRQFQEERNKKREQKESEAKLLKEETRIREKN